MTTHKSWSCKSLFIYVLISSNLVKMQVLTCDTLHASFAKIFFFNQGSWHGWADIKARTLLYLYVCTRDRPCYYGEYRAFLRTSHPFVRHLGCRSTWLMDLQFARCTKDRPGWNGCCAFHCFAGPLRSCIKIQVTENNKRCSLCWNWRSCTFCVGGLREKLVFPSCLIPELLEKAHGHFHAMTYSWGKSSYCNNAVGVR